MSDRESGDEQQQPQAQGKAFIVFYSYYICPAMCASIAVAINTYSNGYAMFINMPRFVPSATRSEFP